MPKYIYDRGLGPGNVRHLADDVVAAAHSFRRGVQYQVHLASTARALPLSGSSSSAPAAFANRGRRGWHLRLQNEVNPQHNLARGAGERTSLSLPPARPPAFPRWSSPGCPSVPRGQARPTAGSRRRSWGPYSGPRPASTSGDPHIHRHHLRQSHVLPPALRASGSGPQPTRTAPRWDRAYGVEQAKFLCVPPRSNTSSKAGRAWVRSWRTRRQATSAWHTELSFPQPPHLRAKIWVTAHMRLGQQNRQTPALEGLARPSKLTRAGLAC